jgi:hypothetical protein
MRLIALGVANAIATILTANVEAADFAYPPSTVVPPQYGVAPAVPPQVAVVPGEPVVVPRYNGSSAPAVVVGSSPYGEAPPVVSPGFRPGTSLPPRAACEPVWRCDNSSCGWGPSCPHPEPYANPYRSPAPPVYSQVPPAPESYASPYGAASPNGAPGLQVYPGPRAPAPQPYSGPYASQGSGPYAPQGSGPYTPQLYSGPPGPMRWIIGPQPYGL